MAALGRSKRVTWPSDGDLCKVRIFLSQDEPLKSVHGSEDHLQEKSAYRLPGGGSNELNMPPGFESPYRNHPKIQMPQIPLIEWQRPHMLILKQEWLVAAGEESEAVYLENARQQGVLEAIYPRPSYIPPNPLISPDVELCSSPDESSALLVPITAPEDEDAADQQEPLPLSSAPLLSSAIPTAEPEAAAAANVAYAIIKSTEEGSLIDPDLLIKLLHEPSMVNKLLSRYNVPKQTQQPTIQHHAAASHSAPLPTQAKDLNYYKSLIQLHGGGGGEASNAANVKKPDLKGRMDRMCIYFNTPKGCRNGTGCLFLHDAASKRVKADRRF